MTFGPGRRAPRDIASRAINAALLDARTFREVLEDRSATGTVTALVVAAAIAAAIGSIDEPRDAISNAIFVLAGWAVYAHAAWFMRGFIFDSIHAEVSRDGMLRVVGIAYGPALLRALGIVPAVGQVIWPVATIWLLVAVVFGLKSTLAFENYWPALGILAVGILLNLVLNIIVTAVI